MSRDIEQFVVVEDEDLEPIEIKPGFSKGTILYCVGIILNSLQHAASKLALQQMGLFETVQARMAITLALSCGVLLHQEVDHIVIGAPDIRLWLGIAGIVTFFTIWATYDALGILSLPDVSAIGFMMPLFTVLIAALFLGEGVVWQQILCSVASFVGVTIIARPFDLFKGDVNEANRLRGVFSAVFGVVGTSITTVILRKVHKTHPMQSVANFSAWTLVGSTVLILAQHKFDYPSNVEQWSVVCAISLFGFGFLTLQSWSLQLEPASYLINFRYTQLVWSILWEVLLWGDWPDIWSCLGTIIVLASAFISTKYRPST